MDNIDSAVHDWITNAANPDGAHNRWLSFVDGDALREGLVALDADPEWLAQTEEQIRAFIKNGYCLAIIDLADYLMERLTGDV